MLTGIPSREGVDMADEIEQAEPTTATAPKSPDAPGEPSSYNTCGQFPYDEVLATFEDAAPGE
jgi:hypothetical protein